VDLKSKLIASTQEIFSTMLMLEATPAEQNPQAAFTSNISGMLGVSGDLTGMLAVHCPQAVATGITGAFLGIEVASIDEDVKDAIGELVNMITGGVKDAFGREGLNVKLAVPTTIAGRSFRIDCQGAAGREIVAFTVPEGTFLVEMKYKPLN